VTPEEREIRLRDIDTKVLLTTAISQLTKKIDTLTKQNSRPPFAMHVLVLLFITGAALGFTVGAAQTAHRTDKGGAHAYVYRPSR
jgi:hypothetical protein